MNKYRVWYSYTEPSCDHPFVLVVGHGLFIDVVEPTHAAAKKYVAKDHYLNRMHENFKVTKSKLIEKDVELIKNVEVAGVKQKHGIGMSLMINGEEVAIVANNAYQLRHVASKICGNDFSLDEEKLINVAITKRSKDNNNE